MTTDIHAFQKIVGNYFQTSQRDLPWRHEPYDAYQILVSEIMLQQTQVSRVIPKYFAFLRQFPDIKSLARAPLSDVLSAWSGLGYNRRAKYLHDAAKVLQIKSEPWRLEDLLACKGIGHNTAAAVLTYAYNQPHVFIETNVRSVYLHHFFTSRNDVSDKEIVPFIQKSLDTQHPRNFYWALMDYGTYLKSTVGNASRNSKHYVKQSRFQGSRRQIRGEILRELNVKSLKLSQLQTKVADERLVDMLEILKNEGLVSQKNGVYQLAS